MGGKMGVWASGSWSDVEDDNAATAFEGNITTGLAGVDYEVAPGVVLGLAAGYEDVQIDTEFNGTATQDGEIDGEGWTVAPYLGVSFSDRVKMDLTAGYSDVEYDLVRFDPNTGNRITGSTDGERYFVSAGLSSTYDLQNNWSIMTRGSAFYAHEEKDAFEETEEGVGSIGNQASVDNELGQLLLDTRFAYDYQMVQPYVLVGLEYDFVKDDTPVAAGQSVSDDDFGAKLGAGINLINMGNITAGIEAYTVEFREDYDEFTVNGGLRVKF
jgi:outer membrane autotransporter protein